MTHVATAQTSALAVQWLRTLCSEYPQYPTVALLRAWELAILSAIELPGPLLDLGCGDGRIAQRLLGRPGETSGAAVGLDIDRPSVHLAAATGFYAATVIADARQMPLATSAFGSIMSVCVLEHIPGVDAVLNEARRVLAPGGRFVFSVPTDRLQQIAASSHPQGGAEYAQAVCERLVHRNSWYLEDWARCLQDNGLEVERAIGYMPDDAARAWFEAYDWTVKPMRGRGLLYRAAGPGLRRFGLGRALASYWSKRLERWAAEGVSAPVDQASGVVIVARKPG